MSCEQLIKEKEKRLGRKLTEKEKEQIMMIHNHSEEEIAKHGFQVIAFKDIKKYSL